MNVRGLSILDKMQVLFEKNGEILIERKLEQIV